MNSRYLLVFFFSVACSCGSHNNEFIKKYPDGQVAIRKIYLTDGDSTSYDIIEYYHNGKPFKEAKIRNGRYVDKKVTYFENGNIKQIDSLIDPCNLFVIMCDGVLIHFYENGKIADRRHIKNNLFSGLTQYYDSNGVIVKEYDLVYDSIKNGSYREFYTSGKLGYSAEYKNDTLIGIEYFFAENGDTLKYYSHRDGIIDLPYKKWLDRGKTLVGNYSKDKQSAIWIWYDFKGNEIKRKIDNLQKDKMIVPE